MSCYAYWACRPFIWFVRRIKWYLSVLLTNLSSNFAVAEISTKAHYVFKKKKDNAPQTL